MNLDPKVLKDLYGEQEPMVNPFPEARKYKPEDVAKGVGIQKKTGVDAILAAERLPEFQAELDQDYWNKLVSESPKSAKFLAASPVNAALMQPDVDSGVLTSIASAAKYLASAPGARNTLMGDIAGGWYRGSGSLYGVLRAGAELAAPVMDPLAGTILPENPLRRLAAGAQQQSERMQSISKYYSPPAEGIVQSGVSGGIQSAVGFGKYAPFLAFGPVGGAAAMAGMVAETFGGSYTDAREKGLQPFQSAAYAVPQAVVEYATEKLPMSKLIGDLASNATVRQMLVQQIKSEVPGEQLATVLQDLNEWAVLHPEKPFSEYLAERPSAAAQTLIATVVGVGSNVAVTKAIGSVMDQGNFDEMRAQQAEQHAQVLQEMQTTMQASEILKTNPETLTAYAQSLVEEGVPEVYVAVETLQEAGIDLNVLAQSMPSVAAQLENLQPGGDLVIPAGELLTNTIGTEFSQSLIDNVRTDPNGMSRAEATVYMQEKGDTVNAEIERVLQEREADTTFKAGRDEIQGQILQQLNTIQRFTPKVNEQYAALAANFYAVMAARTGMTVQDFAAKYKLGFDANTARGSQVMDQTDQWAGQGQADLFPGEFATKRTTVSDTIVVSSKGATETVKRGNANSSGRQITGTVQGLRNFWNWFGDSTATDEKGRPVVMYHSTNGDFNTFDVGRSTINSTTFGDVKTSRHGIFLTPDTKFSQEYLRNGEGQNVMPVYAAINNPIDLREGISGADLNAIVAASEGKLNLRDFSYVDPYETWQFFDDEFGRNFVEAAKVAGYDGAIMFEAGPEGNKPATTYVAFDASQIKSVTGNSGAFSATDPNILNQSMSSRLPGGKKATEDPLDSVLNITFDVVLSDPVSLGKNVAALQQLPNMRKLKGKGAKDDVKNVEAFIQHATANLLWLHDHMPSEMRERAHLWYDGGRKTVEAWANRYGISEMQGAAAIAVLSPQNGWFANVSQAERIADMVFGLRDFAWDDAMTAEATRISSEDGLDERMQAAVGKTLGELLATPDLAARWARVYDQTYNNRAYRVLTPEGGAAGYVQTGKGADATMMWKSYSTIAKAISVLTDGRAENVYYQIGKEHKVRNFYNNIFAPNSDKGFATIDTHAVAAALLRPLASADIEVAQAFGGGGSSSSLATGLNGTYPIYLEAYRRAAEARGILPREMQSITWEAVRGLFEAAKKSGLKKPANAIWERYKAGEIEQEQAQKEILELAGDITPPSWVEVPFNDTPSRTYEGPAQKVIDERGDVGVAEAGVAKTMFEVAPDPADAALTAEWNALTPDARLSISQEVAGKIVPKVLKELGTDGDFTLQLGGYLGATNPSMTLRIARPELTIQAAKLLGHALAQDSMMVVSETKIVGSEAVGAITVKLPDGYGETEVSALYDRLWELERDGQKLVGGHTTADGQMVILNYSGLPTEEFGRIIDAHLGGEFPVSGDEVYSAFPAKEDYGYGIQDEPTGDSAPRKSPAQRRPDNFRSEATQLLREALDSRKAGGTKFFQQGEVNGRSKPTRNGGGRPESRSFAPLEGAPSVPGFHGPDPRVVAVAEQYARDNGIDLKRQAEYVAVDPERAARIAQAYAEMQHAPQYPAVREAYENLIRQTVAQYQALADAGYKFHFIDLSTPEGQDYASTPWNAMRDTRENQRMGVFSTVAGFGSDEDFSPEANPLLADTGLEWPMGPDGTQMQKVLANDLFRAVHDAFGHGMEGAGFRAQGEENAWQAHVRLFTGSAVGAITSETRGQNSFVNFGPNAEANQLANGADTAYADQKTGLMPEWTWTEGRVADEVNTLDQDARGQIAFGNDITQQASIISLLKNADLSTFIHESGHFFLEVQADLARRITQNIAAGQQITDGERSIRDDFITSLKWMGVEGDEDMSAIDKWSMMSGEEKTPYHERFARGFEAYAFEGKAPSLELQSVFQTFRAWLVNVYRVVKQSLIGDTLNAQLNDEVRAVMDRMLATTEAIEEAEAARAMGPLFKTPEEGGMDLEAYKMYHDMGTQASQDAIQEMQARGLRDLQWLQNARSRKLKELQKQHDALRADIAREVRAQVMSQPIYRAWAFLTSKTGEQVIPGVTDLDNADINAASGKLRTQVLRDMYGTEDDAIWRKLSERRMTSDENGTHPDIVAEMFRNEDGSPAFGSADELVQKLVAAEDPKTVIDGMVDQRMLEENGDMATPAGLERAADMAIHNDARARFVATELRALQHAMSVRDKVPGQKNTVDVLAKAAKDYAEQLIAKLKVRDIRPAQYAAAEARAAKAAEKARGNLEKQVEAKRNQLINMAATKAAYAAQEEVKAAVKYFKKFDKVSKSIDQDYQDQIHKLLERFDLRQISNKEIDKRRSLLEWMEAQAIEPDIPEDLLAEANRKSFKEMTVEEIRGLRDTIKQIEHIGRLKNKLIKARDKRTFDEAANAMSASIMDNGGEARQVELEGPKPVTDWFEGVAAAHRKLASLFRQMDGGKDSGPMYDLIGRGMNESGTAEDVMNEKATKKLQAIYAPILKLRGGVSGYKSKLFIPEINASLTRGGRLAVALNWGNEINRKRIVDGDRWSAAQVGAILKTLTPVELEFVNNVWEYLDSFWPEVAAKEKRLTGIEPEKVDAVPFVATASDGTKVSMRGGYYPIKYDSNRSDKTSQQEAAQVAKEMMQGAFTRATTRRGHTKQRVEEVKRAVRKDLNVITQHITQVTHDLAWHEWLIDTNRLLGDSRVANAIRDHYGPRVLQSMRNDIEGIATADVVPQTVIDQILLLLRSNVTRATMGASLTTAFLQPFGLTQSMVRIGSKHVLRGVARWAGDAARMESAINWIHGKSDFMRLRSQTFNKELREIRGSVDGKSKTMQAVDGGLFYMMQKMQQIADVPTWIGQYEKSTAEGLDEAAAVAMADRAVLESQGGGQTKDLAEVQRKHPLLTQFYSYFSVTLNLAAEQTAKTDFKNPRAVSGWLGDMALLMVIPAILPSMLMFMLKGGDEDEPEDWAKKIAEWQLGYLMGTVVGVRELSGAVAGFDYAGPPVGRIVGDIGKVGKQAGQGELDEPAVLATAQLIGTAFGIPIAQVMRSYKGWKAWDGGEEGAGPQSVLFGPPPKD